MIKKSILITSALIITVSVNGCFGGKKLVNAQKAKSDNYSIEQLAEETFFPTSDNPNIFRLFGKKSAILYGDDPFVNDRKNFTDTFTQICKNYNGEIIESKSETISDRIDIIYENITKEYTPIEKIDSNGSKILNLSFNPNKTNITKNWTQYLCKSNTKNIFYYSISPSYITQSPSVVKSSDNSSVAWWNFFVLVNILAKN